MPIRVPWAGTEVSLYRIGVRQLKKRGPRKKNKPIVVVKTKSVPSETKYSLKARLALAKAAIDARGKTFEEVIDHIIEKCKVGRYAYKPKAVYEKEKLARYKQADMHVKEMEEKLAELEKAGVPEFGGF